MKKNLIILSVLLAAGIVLLAISLSMTVKRLSSHGNETDTQTFSTTDTVTDTSADTIADTTADETATESETDQITEDSQSLEPDTGKDTADMVTDTDRSPDTEIDTLTTPAVTDSPATTPVVTEPPVTTPAVTEPPVTTPAVTEPPVTTPAVTEPPVTTPAVTEPPVTTPAVTEPPVTTPAVTEPPVTTPAVTEPPVTEPPSVTDIQNEGALLEPTLQPAQITLLRPTAPGTLVSENQVAAIDYSNTKDGYVMVQYLEDVSVRIKVQVIGPTTTYTYNLTPKSWTAFPLSDGNGAYQIKVYRNVVDTRYATVLSMECNVSLENEFAPFLRPNQYVNYENAQNTMNTAAQIVAGKSSLLDKVDAIYSFVVKTLSYDYYKAATVQSGYLPELDRVLAEKKGICFDYAALMAGMLRSQNIACKLIVGYAGTEYHAWINVWSPDEGWIDGAIFFDGVKWQLMDPTFASTSGSSAITGINYTTKYIY